MGDSYYGDYLKTSRIIGGIMAEKRFELTTFQLRTPGLYTGDPLTIEINWEVECTGFLCNTGWGTQIIGNADGHSLKRAIIVSSVGSWGGKISKLEFHGTMPPHDAQVHLEMYNVATLELHNREKIVRDFILPNLDDFPPDPDPDDPDPGYCTEGETRCAHTLPIAERGGADPSDLMVCSNAKWVLKEKNVLECGYAPPECVEGTTRCVGTTLQRCVNERWKIVKTNALECGYAPPTPPDDGDLPPTPPDDKVKKFWDEYKWWIIGGLAIIAVAVLIIFPPRGMHLPRGGK